VIAKLGGGATEVIRNRHHTECFQLPQVEHRINGSSENEFYCATALESCLSMITVANANRVVDGGNENLPIADFPRAGRGGESLDHRR